MPVQWLTAWLKWTAGVKMCMSLRASYLIINLLIAEMLTRFQVRTTPRVFALVVGASGAPPISRA